MDRTYTVVLTREPNGTYTVEVPTLPGCLTFGETMDHALDMAEDAIRLFLESLEAKGRAIPEDQPAVDLDTTGLPEVLVRKVAVREVAGDAAMPEELVEEGMILAVQERMAEEDEWLTVAEVRQRLGLRTARCSCAIPEPGSPAVLSGASGR